MKSRIVRYPVIDRETNEEVGFCERATIYVKGRAYTAGGSFISPTFAIAYVGPSFSYLSHWDGSPITYTIRVSAQWWQGTCPIYQLSARIGTTWYTGRTQGPSLIWRGVPLKTQPKPTPAPADSRALAELHKAALPEVKLLPKCEELLR